MATRREFLMVDRGPGTTYKMACMGIATKVGVRRVVLTHNGGADSPEKQKPFIEAVGEVFPGEVLFPDELTTIDLLS